MSVRRALEAYSQRMIADTKKKKSKRNKSPEKKVVNEVMVWLKDNGFSCDIVDSAAVYSVQANRYLRGQAKKGMTDIVGITPNGMGAFLEIKALGKRSTLKEHQRDFIKDKIFKGAFAVAVDSVELLEKTYHEWRKLFHLENDKEKAIAYLLDSLPKQRDSKDFDLF